MPLFAFLLKQSSQQTLLAKDCCLIYNSQNYKMFIMAYSQMAISVFPFIEGGSCHKFEVQTLK